MHPLVRQKQMRVAQMILLIGPNDIFGYGVACIPQIVGPNVFSDGRTNGLSIYQ